MILRSALLARIAAGDVTIAFRRWRRPTVRSGGTLLTAIGRLRIASVSAIGERTIAEDEARSAGYASLQELRRELDARTEGQVYRIEFGGLEPDPRIGLRESVPDATDTTAIRDRLARLDDRADAPWTIRVLQRIAAEPGVRAADLAERLGMETRVFKTRVRTLKTLGLTISLETGYRLSPRGESVVTRLAT